MSLRFAGRLLFSLGCAGMGTVVLAQGAGEIKPARPDPVLVPRPPAPKPATASAAREGRMSLDVVVNDAAGKPVTGLEPWDFKVLDNDRSSKILSFRSFDGMAVRPDPPVEVSW